MGGVLGKTFPTPPYPTHGQWWTPTTVAVVTGSNKGLGFHIAQGLSDAGVLTVVTSRNPALGQAAVAKLSADGRKNVAYHQLDVTDQDSVDAFARWIEETHKGLDILVNNAGLMAKGGSLGLLEAVEPEQARTTLATNLSGVRRVTEALLPHLRPSAAGARIVNVSSGLGNIKILGQTLQKRFMDPGLTMEQVEELEGEFLEAMETGTCRDKGWPTSAYGVSKALLNAYTRVLAKKLSQREESNKIIVTAYNPGWCRTDMGTSMALRSPEHGADTAVFLALQPKERLKSGALYKDREEFSY